MTRRAPALLLALILAVAALLSGCRSSAGDGAITPVAPPTQIAPQQSATEGEYAAADYYAPDAPADYEDEIMPAAPDLSDWSAPADSARPGSNEGSMVSGDLTYGVVVGDGAPINPFQNTYRDFYAVNQLVFESVMEFDERMRPTPMLAERWEVSGNDWTFTLRGDVQFHTGELLSAYDVVASYEAVLSNQSTIWYELVQSIDRMEAQDDRTLRVRSRGGMGYMLLYAMTFPVAQRSSVALEQPSGTGPFWYMRYDTGVALRLEANPNWWRIPTDAIHSVVVRCYKSIKSAMVGLELKEVDALATDYPQASLSRSLTDRLTRDYSTQTYECIVPNLRSDILSDLAVRQALMYAIDRTTLGENNYAGMVQESEVPVIPGSWLYEPQATRFGYNPERAQQLLLDAGWNDLDQDGVLEKSIGGETRRLSLGLITYDRGTTVTRSEAVQAIARQLKLVGFEIITETKPLDKALSDIDKGKFDLALIGYELSATPNLAFLLASNAKNSGNYARYSSSVMDGWLHDAFVADTDEALKTAMSKVQLQVVEDLPILGLFFRAGVFISRAQLAGLKGNRQYDVLRGLATVTRWEG
ncbi:ABC transporter substrate-binding protein [Bacillota bacterium Meth-B3]